MYLQKNILCFVRKYQERCRESITIEDQAMISRSIAKSWWRDVTTGKEISIYIHFHQNCFEESDTKHFYGPTKRFDFELHNNKSRHLQRIK